MKELYEKINTAIKQKIEQHLLDYPEIQNKEDFILWFILWWTSEKWLNDEINLLTSEANRVIADMQDKVKRADEWVRWIEDKVKKLRS